MMTTATVYLTIMFNASNWSGFGIKHVEFPNIEACSKSLAEMRLANERQNSGVAVVAFCAPNK